MKTFLKVLGVIVLLIIIAAITIPVVFKDKIMAKAKEEINKNVNAKVDFADVDLSLIRGFPNILFTLNRFSVVGVDEFKGDTLTRIDELALKLSLWDVIFGSQYKIKSIVLNKPYLNVIVLKNGKANYDIAKKDSSKVETGEANSFKLELQRYEINDGIISYDDASIGIKMRMDEVNHSGSGDFTQDIFTFSTKTEIARTNVSYGGVSYLSDVKAALKADLEMDMKNSKYTFKDNLLELNDLPLAFDGYVAMPGDDINMDINWTIKKSDFKSFISLIPTLYSKDFSNVKSSGALAASGFVKGTYNKKSLPAYGIILNIQNGMFKYPSLPAAVNNVQVDLKVSNPDGFTDHTVIDLKRMHIEFGSEPFDARLYATTPVSDPNVDASVKGTVNLANIKNIVPLDKGTDLNGIFKADFNAKGRYSAVQQQQYQNFNASGFMSLSDMKYKSEDFKQGAYIKEVMLTLNPKNITLNTLDMNIGKSDVHADGSLDNFLGYYFKQETLKGMLNVRSGLLDLNEFMNGSTTAASADTLKTGVMEVPANIDFTMNAVANKILYDNLEIDALKGNLAVKDAAVKMNNVTFNTLDGSAVMSGSYGTKNPAHPDIDYSLTLTNMDIQKTFKTFIAVQKLAPVAEHASGKFSSSLTVNGKLDARMSPDIPSLNGSGKLSSNNIALSNFAPLNKLADALKMDQYKKLELKNINISFEFKDGRVFVKPFETALAGTKATIEGSNGFDQTIDYKMSLEIPKTLMPQAAQSAVSGLLAKANSALGSSFALPDPVKVGVGIGGTVTNPTVKTDFGESAKNAANAVKEAVITKGREEARKEADKIIAEAEAKAKQIKDAAKAASDKVHSEGYAQADALLKKADNPIAKIAARKGADALRKETDKKSAQIVNDANKQADGLVNDARKKADDMLK